LDGADLREAVLAGCDLTGTTWTGARGAAVAIFHARNAVHWSTGNALESVADGLGLDDYQGQIEPVIEHARAAGLDVSAPRSSMPPPPISWA
jgi:hypothetical protein